MKQKNQPLHSSPKLWLLCVMCLATFALHAQKVEWTAGYPNTSPSPVIATETGYIVVQFTPTGANINNARVEVNLPTNVSYDGSTTALAAHTNSALGAVTEASGKVTVNFAGSTLTKDKLVAFQLRIKTTCEFTSGPATIQVLSGGNPVPDETNANAKAVTVYAQKPDFSVTAPTGTESQTVANLNQDATFNLNIRVTNGTASTAKLTFTTNQYITLSAFSMSGVTLTQPTAPTAAPYVWELTIPTTFNTTAKTLSFKARTSQSGSHIISVAYNYPSTGNACVSGASKDFVLTRNSGNVGTPVVNPTSMTWVKSDLTTAMSIHDISLDGVTPNYLKVVYTNTNVADAFNCAFYIYASGNAFKATYIKHTDILYQFGTETPKPFPAANITPANLVRSDAQNNALKTNVYNDNNPTVVTLRPQEVFPKNQTITFYVPCVAGAIYDNSSNANNVAAGFTWQVLSHYRASVTAVKAENGTDGVAGAFVSNSAPTIPRLAGVPSAISVRPTSTGKTTFQMAMGSYYDNVSDAAITTPATTEIFVKLPDWMILKNSDLSTAMEWDGVAVPATSHGNNTYSIVVANSATANFTLNYEVAAAYQGATVNRTDNIEYWLNYNPSLTASGSRATRPVLERMAQVKQSAMLLAEREGIVMTDFGFRRTSIGFKDDDNNGIPDDGSLANPDAPTFHHELFYLNDNGKLVVKGTVAGSPTDTYQNMYLLLSSSDFNLATNFTWIAGTIKVNNLQDNSASVEIVRASNTQYYYLYKKALKGGDMIEMEIPFTIISANTTSRSIKAEMYMTAADKSYSGTAVFGNPADRLGKEFLTDGIIVASSGIWFNGDNWPKKAFTNNNKNYVDFAVTYTDITTSTPRAVPYEARQLYQYKKFEIDVADGYEVLNTDQLRLSHQNSAYNNSVLAGLTRYMNCPLIETRPYSNANSSGTTYVYDLTAVFDPNYTDASPGTVWPAIDEAYYFYYQLQIKATKGAPQGDTRTQLRIILDDHVTGDPNRTLTSNLIWTYRGDATAISAGSKSIPAYGKIITVPAVRVENLNDKAINMWLYVDGPATNIKLKKGATTVNPVAGSFEGRWLKLPDFAAFGYDSYNLEFDYSGATSCASDSIVIYTVSGFNTTWAATTAAKLNFADADHVGGRVKVNITPAPASIAGSMAVSSTLLSFNVPYTVTATIDATGSPGLLRNAQMSITIPAGQFYVSGSAQIEYPKGTKVNVTAAINTALLAGNSNIAADRTFIFDVGACLNNPNFMFSGNQETAVTDDYRRAVLTANFQPRCDTKLTGIRYVGTLSGANGCGEPSNGTGRLAPSAIMFSNVRNDYEFDVTAVTKSGKRAYNEIQKDDEVVITLKKKDQPAASTANMQTTDYLQVTLPEAMNIAAGGFISVSSSISGVPTTATVTSNIVSGGVRTIVLSLPVSAFNADIVKGVGKDITYNIPVTYTVPTAGSALLDVKNRPEKTIDATVLTRSQFDVSCPVQNLSIGYASIGIALVKAKENPTATCKGESVALEIESIDFGGKWYSAADKTGELGSGAAYSYTPAAAQDKTLYVSALFNNNDYGVVPVQVNVYPELLVDFTGAAVCEGTETKLVSNITVGGLPDISKIKRIEWYKDGEAVAFSIAASPEIELSVGTHSIKLTAETVDGCVISATKNVVVNPSPVAIFSASAPVCEGSIITFTSTSNVASGTISKYSWDFGDNSTKETTTNTTTYGYIAAGTYDVTLEITTNLGCTDKAVRKVVVFPQPVFTVTTPDAICNGTSINLNTAISGISANSTVKFYSNATATTEVTNPLVSPTATTDYYVQSTNSVTTCKSEIKKLTVTVNPVPAAPTVAAVTLCQNAVASPLTATAASGNTLKWYDAGGTALTGAPVPSTAVAGTFTYKVSQVNTQGCESPQASLTVTVTALPAAPTVANPNPVYCQNATPTALTATGTNLKWYDETDNLLSTTIPTISTATVGTKIYKVTQSTAATNGCESKPTTITVTVNALPTFTVTAPAAICAGNSLNLASTVSDISAGSTVKYYSNAGATTELPSATVSPTATTPYYAQSTIAATGCKSAIQTINVVVNALPAAPTVTNVTLCQNAVASPLTATAASGNTLKWYDAGGTALTGAPVPSTAVAGTFTYKVSQVNTQGCESPQASLTVTVTALPAAPTVANPNPVYCQNATPTALTATGTNLKWYDENDNYLGTTVPTVSTVTVGTKIYKVTQSTAATNGCESKPTTITVTVNALPTFTVTVPAAICAGNSLNLASTVSDISAGSTVKYYSNNTATTELASATVSPTATTPYYAQSTITATGCKSAIQTINVVVNALPAAPTTAAVTLCQNAVASPLTATAASGNTLKWYDAGGTALPGAPVPSTAVAGTFTYKVSQVNTQGCESPQASITVTVTALPAAPTVANPNPVYCQNAAPTALTATGTNLKWYDENDNLLSAVPTVSTTIVGTTIYKVSQSTATANGCESPKTIITIKVNELPTFSVNNPAPICTGASLNLATAVSNISAGSTVKYYSNAGATTEISNQVSPTATTDYYVQSTSSATSCKSEIKKITVTVNAKPTFTLTPATASICLGETYNLKSAISGITPATGNNSFTYTLSGSTSSNSVVQPEVAGSYVYEIQLTSGDCQSDIKTFTLTVNALPKIEVLGGDACVNSTITFTANVTPTGGTGTWYSSNNAVATVSTAGVVTGKSAGTFEIIYRNTSTTGCQAEATSATYNVFPLPTITVQDATICAGTVVETSSLVKNILNGDKYNLYTAATAGSLVNTSVTPAATTTYYVEALSTAANCVSAARIPVTVNVISQPTFTLPATTSVCTGGSVDLATLVTGANITGYKVVVYKEGETIALGGTNVTPSGTSTIYNVKIVSSDDKCESALKSIRVNSGSQQYVSLTGTTTLCSGATTTLTASPAGTGNIRWTSDNESIATVSQSGVVSGNVGGQTIIRYSFTDVSGCHGEGEKAVTVNETPKLLSINNRTVCQGETVLLSELASTSEGNRLNFYSGATLQTIDRVTVGTANIVYKVEAENIASGCKSAPQQTVTITANAKPTFTVSNASICQGESIDLASLVTTALSDYSLIVEDAAGKTLASSTVTPQAQSTTYRIRVINNAGGCTSDPQRINITLKDKPLLTVRDLTACVGATIDLNTAVIGTSLKFYRDAEAKDLLPSSNSLTVLAGETTYYVQGETNGCKSDIRPVKITGNEVPVPEITSGKFTVCDGEKGVVYTAPAGKTNYIWTVTGGTKIDQTANELVVDWTLSGARYEKITLTYASGGCSAATPAEYRVTLGAVPNPGYSVTLSGVEVTELCAGSDLDLSPFSADGTWTITPSALATVTGNVLTATSNLYHPATFELAYSVSNTEGCTAEEVKTITINPLPIASDIHLKVLSGITHVCSGEKFALVGSYTPGLPRAVNSWTMVYNDGIADSTLTNLGDRSSERDVREAQGKTYRVTNFTDGNGCTVTNLPDAANLKVVITLKEPVKITAQPENVNYCETSTGETISFTVSAAGENPTYQWYAVTDSGRVELAGETNATLNVTISDTIARNYYVVVSGDCNADSSAVVTASPLLDIIVQKRNHTLIANNNASTNGGYNFQYYKWYKDGELLWENLGGATKGGYYYTGGANLSDVDYWVIVKDVNGKEYRSCPFRPVLQVVSTSVQAYPNPTSQATGTQVYVDVEIDDETQLAGAIIDIYTASGAFIGKVPATGRITSVTLPSVTGVYVLQFKSDAITKEIKIIVE